MFFGMSMISMAVMYSADQNHLIREYLKIRDETDWGMITWPEYSQKLKQLNEQYAAVKRAGG